MNKNEKAEVINIMKNNKKIKNLLKIKSKIQKFKNKLIIYSNDKDYSIRLDAIAILSLFYDGDIDRAILNALKDKEELVRVSALEAILLPKNNEKVFDTIAKYLNDKSWLVQAYAINALADNNAKKYHLKIKSFLNNTQNDEVLVRVYYALVKFGEKKYLKRLIKMLKHDNYRVRCAVANLLYYLENKKNHELIIKKLEKALKLEKTKAAKSCIQGALGDMR